MILVTGAAGFIGYHVVDRLLKDGHKVRGVDNLNDFYEPALKLARLKLLEANSSFAFDRADIADKDAIGAIFKAHRPDYVIHLAAQAGVRLSITAPRSYIESNVMGFLNILEGCRNEGAKHLVYASSSSVYGLNTAMPFSADHTVDHPVSLYGATKKANELMAHSYSHLYALPTTGLRFFTVYGPWGRPDMAYFLFTRAILAGTPIDVYNNGKMRRDFTYVDDVVEGVARVVLRPASPNPNWRSERPESSTSLAPYHIYNVGNHSCVELGEFISVIEACLGKKAVRRLLPAQPGDVLATTADVADLGRDFGFEPKTPIDVGIRKFVDWYRRYYNV